MSMYSLTFKDMSIKINFNEFLKNIMITNDKDETWYT